MKQSATLPQRLRPEFASRTPAVQYSAAWIVNLPKKKTLPGLLLCFGFPFSSFLLLVLFVCLVVRFVVCSLSFLCSFFWFFLSCFFVGSLLVRSLLLPRVLLFLFVLLSFSASFCLVFWLSPSCLSWHNYRRKFWLEALQDNPQISSPASLWIHLQVTLHYFTRRNTEFGRSDFRWYLSITSHG